MSICWHCYWGWPKAIADIYDDAVEELGGCSDALVWGPAHIVWEDENFDHAQWCLDHFSEYEHGFSPSALSVVRRSLERLLLVPDHLKHPPEGYDDEHPEKFEPPKEWEVRRR